MDSMADRNDDPDRPATTRPTWKDGVVLVCRECDGTRHLDPKQARQVLKHEAKRVLGRRSVIVVETACMDVCPKKAIAVAALGAGGGWDRVVTVRSAHACCHFIDELAADRSAAEVPERRSGS
jgi:hypothetical protein